MWMNTTYEPGTVKVIAYDESGKIAETKEISTTVEPCTAAANSWRRLTSRK